MIIYIAGPMTGFENYNREVFADAEYELGKRGHIFLNPGYLPFGMPDEKYMPICIAMVEAADAVYALPHWRDSLGASVEVFYALRQGKKVYDSLNAIGMAGNKKCEA